MTWLYASLLAFSILVPLALSFDSRLQFYKRWKYLFPAIIIVAIAYIVPDVFFTRYGHWGFNENYYLGLKILGLPVEEWLFFVAVPYASIFLHETLLTYFPKIRLGVKITKTISVALLVLFAVLAIAYRNHAYTLYMSVLMLLALALAWGDYGGIMRYFYVTFLAILIPFIVVNGVLTGSFIEGEVVWYNNTENLGIRLFTIPVEDFGYGFSMLYFNLWLSARFKNFKSAK